MSKFVDEDRHFSEASRGDIAAARCSRCGYVSGGMVMLEDGTFIHRDKDECDECIRQGKGSR